MKIRRGDLVQVITGDEASSTPHKVIQVLRDKNALVVEGVNRVYKHVRRGHPKSPQGGRLHVELPISISNVAYHCESCSQASRLGYRHRDDGAKERFCRKCGAAAGQVSPPRRTASAGS